MLSEVLARNWWAFVVRGLLAVLFGIVTFLMPGATMLSLVWVFAAYAISDGIFAIVAAVRAAKKHRAWGPLTLEGIVDIVAGLAALALPGLTVMVFVTLVAFWALATGGLMVYAAFNVDADHGRWWMALGGLVSILYGAALIIAPLIGALVLTWWIGAYAILFGVAMLVFAFRLRAGFNHLTTIAHA